MAWGTAVAGALSAIGSLVGGSMQNSANANLNKSNMRWQEAMTKWNQNWQEKMWQKENEYNTPLAQRQRLQEAGYNPWISGSGGMSNVSQGVPQTSSPTPPSMIPMQDVIGPAARSGVSAAMQQVQTQAQASNQLAQAAQSGVDTAIAIYEKTGDADAAEAYLSNVLSTVGGGKIDKDSLYFRQLNLAITGIELDNAQKDYQNSLSKIQVMIQEQTGLAKAQADLNMIDQQITESVARIGKMASDVKVNEAEVQKLLSEEAMNIAKKNNLDADTQTINGIRDALIDKAVEDAAISKYQKNASMREDEEGKAEFVSRRKARNWLRSDAGQNEQLANEIDETNSKANLVNKIVRGQNRKRRR